MVQTSGETADTFAKYFRVDLAYDDALLDKVHYIRYRVYCEEFGYEPKDRCPNQRERDEFDAASLHCLVTHLPSNQPAACVRLVPTSDDDPKSDLPFEKYCRESLDRTLLSEMGLDRAQMCEVSRLAVDRSFRRRPGEHETRIGNAHYYQFSDEERRTFPFIAVSAYLAATAIMKHTGRQHAFAMMEPFLPRLLRRTGIHFSRVGADTDYHGVRAAYHIETQSALSAMNPDLVGLYSIIERQLFG
ncbi:MAG: PEP-CTERM/exosortase system-associated acyltransferase [Thiohalocapsa sp.]|jgi:N-acyl amino acid synthase of PEP-CTERM/exosortase system|nr:PEP-CTERM/exosortase system-associated acyltransferase [Thiohalocapsa sp.]